MEKWSSEDNIIKEEIRVTKRKTFKTLIFSLLAVLLVSLSYGIYWIYFEQTFLTGSNSPDGNAEVEIYEYGNGLLRGSEAVKVYFSSDGKTIKTKKIRVDNLKESNHKERYNATWKNKENVTITMRFEKSTKTISYNFSTDVLIENKSDQSNQF
ncbi:hypothetical protein ABE28_009375 [Peribacillus muralis]|uniref:DUF5412 domain-containing protein n=1 Tax=Peribacillus muralis TaxID=264697 RepID=A0A1B3XMV7_9BACI|nr:DUF5412 family protein [Peribacillus muralis]AOH54559.1 hypothetical protein ABE28_009375 [Peribacillus muralis]